MSLYTPPSTIRRLILEAEQLTLNPSADATQVEADTSASPMDIAANVASTATAPTGGGLQGSTLSMPSATPPPSTVSKTVINKDIILAQLAELKSVITNYEKQFEGDDLTPEDGNVYISSLLSTLVFHAEKFNAFMESTPGEAPAESPMEALPEALPTEAPVEPPPAEEAAVPSPEPGEAPPAEEAPLGQEPAPQV